MQPAASLYVDISAPTEDASAKLTRFNEQVRAVQRVAEQGIRTRLAGEFNPAAFDKSLAYMDRVSRRARDRAAFRAELGANFDPRAFNSYERAVDQAERQTARLRASQEAARRSLSQRFFTGSRSGGSEERSFARGTLRGAVSRGGGFLGGGLAGGLLGYVSAQGIKSSIEGTTQMVRQAEILSHYTGISRQNALSLEAVSNALGVSSRGLGVGFRTLATAANTALTNPTKASTAAFRELGLSQEDVKAHSKDLGALFGVVADRLNRLPQGTERTALAAKLLGRNWQQLAPLIEQGSKGIAEQTRQAQALGVTLGGDPLKNIARLHEAEINLKLAQEGLSIQFTEHVAPALIKVSMGAIKLAEAVRRDLAPVFRDLSPIVRDVGHWLEQNKGIVEGLVGALVGLKIIRTVGGWFGGLYNDIKSVYGAGKALIGFFTESGAAADAESAQVNALAASYERLALAQKGAIGGGAALGAGEAGLGAAEAGVGVGAVEAAGAGAAGFGLGLGVLPFAALYAAGVGRGNVGGLQDSAGRKTAGLGSLLGPVGQSAVARTTGPANNYVMARFGDVGAGYAVRQTNAPATLKQLEALQAGLRGVTNVSQIAKSHLGDYYVAVQRLLQQPDLTSTQRRGLQRLEQMLTGVTPAVESALDSRKYAGRAAQLIDSFHSTFSWMPRYAQTSGRTTTEKVRAVQGELQHIIRTGSAAQRNAARPMLQRLVRDYGGWMSQIETDTRNAEISARRSLERLGADWQHLGSVIQTVVSKEIVPSIQQAFGGMTSVLGIHLKLPHVLTSHPAADAAGHRGWDVPTRHHHHARAARHAAAAHEYLDPFTGAYEPMTSAQHRTLLDRYERQYNRAPSTAAGRRHAATLGTAAGGGQAASGTGGSVQVPSQTAALQIQFQQLANQLQTAQNTNNVAQENRILHRQVALEKLAVGRDNRKLATINAGLRGAMNATQRVRLLADKLTILQDIGNLQSEIGSAMSSIQGLGAPNIRLGQFGGHYRPVQIVPESHAWQTRYPSRNGSYGPAEPRGGHQGGLHIGQVVVNGNNMDERQMMNELYRQVRPMLSEAAY